MQPINDLCQIELDQDEFGFGGGSKTTAESGILIALPGQLDYLGFWSFAFEKSFGNYEVLRVIHDHYAKLIGKRVFWTALSEKGNIIEKDGKRYAFIKLTSLICVDEPDSAARNIHGDGAGAFSV